MASFITNFMAPKTYEELLWDYTNYGGSNLDEILSCDNGTTNWTVHEYASKGDTVYFFCGVTARKRMSDALQKAYASSDAGLICFAKQQAALYKEYSGYIVAVGKVSSNPVFDKESQWKDDWRSDIDQIRVLKKPIHYSKFKEFAPVRKQRTVTLLNEGQTKQLNELIAK